MTDWDAWDTRIARAARKEWRAFAAKHPAFARKLRKMSDAELDHLEASLLEQQITYLRRLPNFDKDPATQSLVGNYEYALRLNREIAAYRAHPVKRSIPRRSIKRRPFIPRSAVEPEPSPLAAPSPLGAPALASDPIGLRAASGGPSTAEPKLEPVKPEPDNVIAFPRCYAKAFHGGREIGPGYSGTPDNEVW